LLTTNEVKCWGDNQYGQLGLGDTNHRGDQANEMGDALPAIDFGTRVPKALAAGSLHTCALFTSNEVACWGYGLGGPLGLGNNVARGGSAGQMGASLAVVNLGTGLTAKAIATGDSHTCALLSNNQVKCWGMNAYGQLGLGDVANRGDNSSVVDGFLVSEMGDNLPVIALGTGRTAKAVYAGGNKTCVLLDTSQVKCWGEGYLGALGRGDEQNRGDSLDELADFAPTIALGTGRTVLSMTTGATACALLDSNQLKCWGNNFSGQLGRGDRLRRGAAPDQMGDFLPSIDLGPELPP
jgi:alpha-tubulin suppressor-like RCC1 family protein